MHSIERYGIVALLFLVVTVVAVLMWDGGKDKQAKPGGPGTSPPATAIRPNHGDGENAAERRLSLLAESRPGPLERNGRGRRGAAAARAQGDDPGGVLPLEADAEPADEELHVPESAPRTLPSHTLPSHAEPVRAEPVREEGIGQARPPATHGYAVRPGDTLSEIAQRELGSSRRWQEIVAVNPGLDPGRLLVGKVISIPGSVRESAGRSDSAPSTASKTTQTTQTPKATETRGTWKVGKGENLWKIAAETLGDGKRWGEIAALNPKVDPDKLHLGQVLILPASTRTASSTKPASAPRAAQPEPAKLVARNVPESGSRRGGRVK